MEAVRCRARDDFYVDGGQTPDYSTPSLGIQTAYKAAKGQAIEANVDTGTEMATKENAADFK